MVFYMPNRGVARIFVWGGVGGIQILIQNPYIGEE